VRTFDGAAGGLGGCPFAPGAPGNLATEALIRFLEDSGYRTGVDAGGVARAAETIKREIGLNADRPADERGAS
jgi:hypothetical protein